MDIYDIGVCVDRRSMPFPHSLVETQYMYNMDRRVKRSLP